MTGFLDRMAARALGGLPAAQPRLPSRFGPPETGSDETGAEQTTREQTHVVASGPEPRADAPPAVRTGDVAGRQAPAALAPIADSPVQQQPSSRPAQRRDSTVGSLPPRQDSDPRRPSERPVQAVSRTVEVIAKDALPAAQPAKLAAALPKAGPAVATTTVAASPVPLALFEPAMSSPVDAQEAREDVVHISIGRVEVRAALPAPGAPRRAPAGKQTDQLPLRDYLRGKRDA